MERFEVLIVSVFCTLVAFPQKRNVDSATAFAEITGGYIYIPKSALDDKFDAVLIVVKDSQTTFHGKRNLNFWWNSLCNDGYYNLTITPKQIYFHSSHDNPNPNYLYWVIDIDSAQYSEIMSGLKLKTPKGFSNRSKYSDDSYDYHDDKFKNVFKIPDEWTDAKEKEFDSNCATQIKQQLSKYFSILNGFIKGSTRKITLPSEKDMSKVKPKLFTSNEEELSDWRPHKFVPPVLKD